MEERGGSISSFYDGNKEGVDGQCQTPVNGIIPGKVDEWPSQSKHPEAVCSYRNEKLKLFMDPFYSP
jgi:hypothetical protein